VEWILTSGAVDTSCSCNSSTQSTSILLVLQIHNSTAFSFVQSILRQLAPRILRMICPLRSLRSMTGVHLIFGSLSWMRFGVFNVHSTLNVLVLVFAAEQIGRSPARFSHKINRSQDCCPYLLAMLLFLLSVSSILLSLPRSLNFTA
jgi:hypothetical protein